MRSANGQFIKGHGFWSGKKRKPFSEEWKDRISSGVKKANAEGRHKMPAHRIGKDNNKWRGDDASYAAKHMWVYHKLGRITVCSNCGLEDPASPRRFHWHNISGKYKRNLSDWVRLCAHCHKNVHSGKISIYGETNDN